MKYLSEYREAALVSNILEAIRATVSRPWKIMEVCGGQTHSLVKHGLLALLPGEITMIHGPGCPVCVTPAELIDQAIALAQLDHIILCTYGDMMRVPGTHISLLQAKALGADVRILYSPLDALPLAESNPGKEVVFFAVGFETTAPANALSVVEAQSKGLNNYSILSAQVLVPPAIEAILMDKDTSVDGFLAPGHVCTVMGTDAYQSIVEKYQVPIVVTGFEPVDLLEGIWMVLQQLENGVCEVENQYKRVVQSGGNPASVKVMNRVFETSSRNWRGLGTIPLSGLEVQDAFEKFNAKVKFPMTGITKEDNSVCLSGEIMKGKMKPDDCPYFGKTCTPQHPIGAPMVSSEGACAAYFQYQTS